MRLKQCIRLCSLIVSSVFLNASCAVQEAALRPEPSSIGAHHADNYCAMSHLAPAKPDSALLDALKKAQQAAPEGGAAPAALKAKVFIANKIITMDPMYPQTEAIATLGDRILALGTLQQVKQRVRDMPYEVITDFRNDVIYPGFIEAHAHAQTAGLEWMTIYLGQMRQMRPDGVVDPGPQSIAELRQRIKHAADTKKSGEWLFGWGYDPTILKYDITVKDLDPISGNHPLFILDASMHQAYVNTAALKIAGFDEHPELKGIVKDADGKPTGRIEELEVLQQMIKHFPPITKQRMIDAQWTIAKLCNLKGITTVADMNYGMVPHGYEAAVETAKDPEFPVRLSAYVLIDVIKDPRIQQRGGFELVKALQQHNLDKFRIAGVKFIIDGSNQGGTGVFRWPYYYDGRPNGVYNYDPKQLERDLVELYKLGIQPTMHVNADGALDVALEAVKNALREHPVPEHRTTLQHVQVADDEQFKMMKRLGISPNFLINHIYYWGDDWLTAIGGPVKGSLINAAGSAQRNGLRFSLHSDHPVTPIDRLLAMSVATNRKSINGTPIGPSERISIYDALRAITADAAFLLGEEREKGSIEIGKLADFTVLDRDILAMQPEKLREAKVVATVIGGVVHKVPVK